MQISVNQINGSQLTLFINNLISGDSFTGSIQSYLNNSGYLGPIAVVSTGGNQYIYGTVSFDQPIGIPYSGGTGQSTARKYIDDTNCP